MANAGNIRAWLAELGLAKYAEAFANNAIDLDVVRELTEADLKDLGIEAMGDRKRLLRAIASLATAKESSVVATAARPSPTGSLQIIVFLAGDETDSLQGGEMLFGFG